MTTPTTTPNTLHPAWQALLARALGLRARAFRGSADAAERGILASSRHIDSAEYLGEQATLFTDLAAKLEGTPASFTLAELHACREAAEVQRRRAARRLGGEQATYWRLLDKLAQMASFIEPSPWPVVSGGAGGAVHYDVSTTEDGMHLPRCGQVSAKGYGPARTHYTTDPTSVTCIRCSAALAKAALATACPLTCGRAERTGLRTSLSFPSTPMSRIS